MDDTGNSIRLQVISLAQEQTVAIDHILSLPQQEYQDALVAFSADLSLVFIGNVVIDTLHPEMDPRLVQVEMLHRASSESKGIWACTFAACSQYIALHFDPMDFQPERTIQEEERGAKIFVFYLCPGRKSPKEVAFPNVDITACGRLYSQFHPASEFSTALLLRSWEKASLRTYRFVCQLLDVRNGNVEQIGSEVFRQPSESALLGNRCF